MLGDELIDIWKMLGATYHDPAVLRASAITAAKQVKHSGIFEAFHRQKSARDKRLPRGRFALLSILTVPHQPA